MSWKADLKEGERFASDEDWNAAWDCVANLLVDQESLQHSEVQRFIFKVACARGMTAVAEAAARALRLSPDDEDLFTAASWYHTMAAEALEAGDKEKAQEHLDECLEIAPNHAGRFMSDPRVKGLQGPSPPPSREAPEGTVPSAAATPGYKRRVAKAQALMAAGRYEEAADIIFRFTDDEMILRGSLRLFLEVLVKLGKADDAHPFAMTLLQGSKEDRRLVALWYVECAAARKTGGDVAGAANLLNEAVSKLPEYQNAFAAEPRIKGLVSPKDQL
jgi:tetratricopeptide (TPR) repeat protein